MANRQQPIDDYPIEPGLWIQKQPGHWFNRLTIPEVAVSALLYDPLAERPMTTAEAK